MGKACELSSLRAHPHHGKSLYPKSHLLYWPQPSQGHRTGRSPVASTSANFLQWVWCRKVPTHVRNLGNERRCRQGPRTRLHPSFPSSALCSHQWKDLEWYTVETERPDWLSTLHPLHRASLRCAFQAHTSWLHLGFPNSAMEMPRLAGGKNTSEPFHSLPIPVLRTYTVN